jgi:hypothetical protein
VMRFRLERVHYMPKELESGVLYVAEEFGTAAHLCACGCGSKIRTPIGATEWQLEETVRGPSLRPSIGNWQKPCQSHYWIEDGEVIWSEPWSREEIDAGRAREEARRAAYYDALYGRRFALLRRAWEWVKQLFTR